MFSYRSSLVLVVLSLSPLAWGADSPKAPSVPPDAPAAAIVPLTREQKRALATVEGRQLHHGPAEAKAAAQRLAVLGADAEPALQDLVYALGYDEEDVAVAVSSAVVIIGARAVPPLTQALDDPNFFIRRRAAGILATLGPAAAPAADALVGCLNDAQVDVVTAADKALRQIGAGAVPAVSRAYRREASEGVRRQYIRILGALGPDAAPVLVQAARKDASGFVRLSAIEELSRMQPIPRDAMGVITVSLQDLDESVRGAAADALASIGPAAAGASSSLKRLAETDPDSLVRQKAAEAYRVVSSTEPKTP